NAHMHLRGKSMRFEAHYPNGEREVLLDIPRYDFDWQTVYLLRSPKELPKGTRLHCLAHFDNSADNLRNPDPNRIICYGHQTWQEMMAGTVGFVVNKEAKPDSPPTDAAAAVDVLAGYLPVDEVPAERRGDYFVQRALYREQRADSAGAIADLALAIQENPDSAEPWYERGRLHQQTNDNAAALADLNEAVARSPRDAKYLVERGWAKHHLQDPAGAIADFDEAIVIAPRNHRAWFFRAVVRLTQQDVPTALAELETLTRDIHPGFAPARWELAKLLLALGREAEARAQFDAVVEIEPDRATECELKYASRRWQQGRLEEATAHLNTILASEPDNAEARSTLAMIRFQQGEKDAGLEQLRELVRFHPDNPANRLQLAQVLSQLGDSAEALATYREARRVAPENLDVSNALAWELATCSNDSLRSGDDAVQLAEEVCAKSDPPQPSYLDTLAAAYAEAGRYAEAIKTADRAAKLAIAEKRFSLAVDIQERRRLYRQKRPFHAPIGRLAGS
ncbi:MAG: tetratricopeptide repeat protein, partial [Pirellulales bacterium]